MRRIVCPQEEMSQEHNPLPGADCVDTHLSGNIGQPVPVRCRTNAIGVTPFHRLNAWMKLDASA